MSAGITPEPGFSAARLARLAEIERWHFWFAGRRALVHRLLRKYLSAPKTVLDIGCGTGCMLDELAQQGYRMAGLDLRPEGLHATHRRLPQIILFQAQAGCLPLAENSFDGVILLDVMEHADDVSILREAGNILKPGGIAVLTVPALPWLWSYRDRAAGHLRRYTRKDLRRLLLNSGFEIQEIHYYQCLLLPVVVLTRLLGRHDPALRDMEEQPLPLLNTLLLWINRFEVSLGRVVPWPWGSTLVAVCKK